MIATFRNLDVRRSLLRRQQPRRGVIVEILRQMRLGTIPRCPGKPPLRLAQIALSPRAEPCALSPVPCIQNTKRRISNRFRRSIQPRRSQDLFQFARAHNSVDFRNILPDLVPIALHQATGHNEPPRPAIRLVLRHLEDRIDGLLLGRVNKRAGIDDENLGRLHVGRHLRAGAVQQTHHDLAVDEVLGAAQRDKPDLRTRQGPPRQVFEILGIDGAQSGLVEKSLSHLSILPEKPANALDSGIPPPNYSARSASTGSTAAVRRAGR